MNDLRFRASWCDVSRAGHKLKSRSPDHDLSTVLELLALAARGSIVDLVIEQVSE